MKDWRYLKSDFCLTSAAGRREQHIPLVAFGRAYISSPKVGREIALEGPLALSEVVRTQLQASAGLNAFTPAPVLGCDI
jgi:hypothetical protein